MTLRYRTTGAWGAGEGANLTPAQVDENFYTLAQQIASFSAPAGVGISEITVSGDQMTIHLTNATVLGPFTLPVAAFHWVEGGWVAGETYQALDVFAYEDDPVDAGVYLVLQEYDAPTEFDPSPEPNTDGEFLVKMFSITTDESTGALTVIEAEPATDGILSMTSGMLGAYVRVSGDSADAFFVPLDTTLSVPVGTTVTVRYIGSGSLVLVGENDTTNSVVVNIPTGRTAVLYGFHSTVTLIKVGENEWDASGDLALEVTA